MYVHRFEILSNWVQSLFYSFVLFSILGLVAADYDASVATLESIALSLGNLLKPLHSYLFVFILTSSFTFLSQTVTVYF